VGRKEMRVLLSSAQANMRWPCTMLSLEEGSSLLPRCSRPLRGNKP
jgi:hypothetical protein